MSILQETVNNKVDTLLQPISKTQASYLKDTTGFINFIEKTKVNKNTFLVSMDVTSLRIILKNLNHNSLVEATQII